MVMHRNSAAVMNKAAHSDYTATQTDITEYLDRISELYWRMWAHLLVAAMKQLGFVRLARELKT